VSASLIYKSAALYELAMIGLYGPHYPARYRAVADLIPPGSSVLDLCCGPAVLYRRYLRRKDVDYLGLDMSETFVNWLNCRGVRAQVQDVGGDAPLPPADCVIMQASLYHFLPDPLPVIERMREAAREQVIIAEPVRNLTCTNRPLLASLARRLTNPGAGGWTYRFTEKTLDRLMNALRPRPVRSLLVSGGREKVYVFQKC
jgi:SAM-dependent methyltransferase